MGFEFPEIQPTKYSVYSNKNIELINIVEFLDSSDEYTNCGLLGTIFLYRAKNYFGAFKNCEVVSEYQRFIRLDQKDFII